MELLRAGEGGLLCDLDPDDALDADARRDAVLGLTAGLDAAAPTGVLDLVPAARTVLVRFDPAQTTAERIAAAVGAVALGSPEAGARTDPVTLPIVYDGDDLDAVSREVGLSPEEVATRHAAGDYVVAFCGFAPGFGYLTGADPALHVPRAATPRTRVPPGAVGLAGVFTGAYPRASPGGWRLIGRTDALLFDADAAEPALLSPGARVRFERRADADVGEAPGSRGARRVRAPDDDAALEILAPGALTTIQDLGRSGRARLGIGWSGAADPPALRRANRLLGNAEGAAALEVTLGGLRLLARRDLLLAASGTPVGLTAGGRSEGPDALVRLRAGEELRLDAPPTGLRTYLAVRGGLAVPAVAGGAATDVLAGLGPRPLEAGDGLAVGPPPAGPPLLGVAPVRALAPDPVLRVLPGPRDAWFAEDALARLTGAAFVVSDDADRVGLRLDGPALERVHEEELPSEGVAAGSLQVSPDGRPVLFLADHPVTGGYPVIAVLDGRSLARAAQLRPGDALRFALADS